MKAKWVENIFVGAFLLFHKGQIKPKADWRAVDSPKKRRNEFVLLAFLLFMARKVHFLGESMARQSAFGFI